MKIDRYCFLFLGFLICLTGYKAWAYTPEECIKCHREGSKESLLQISIEGFEAAIHSREETTCPDCHMGVTDEAHETTKGSGAVDCSECHEEENKHGQQSKTDDRPRCYSCHPKHRMLEGDNRASAVHPDQLKNTCKGCHPVESGETDYFSWLPSLRIVSHKKGDFSQAYGKDNCIGCHQGQAAHGEEEPLDEQNCHLCHASVGDQGTLMGYIHARADYKKQPATFAAATIYQVFIVLLLWGGFRFYVLNLSGKIRKRRK